LQKIINFRSFFFLFITSLFTIFIGVRLNLSLYYLFALIIPLIFIAVLIVLKKYKFLCFSICLLTFFCTYSFLYIKNYNDTSINPQEEYSITATVKTIKTQSSGFSYLTLSNVYVSSSTTATKVLKGNTTASFYDYSSNSQLTVGDKISFKSSLSNVEVFKSDNTVNAIYVVNNIRFEVNKSLTESNITITNNPLPLNERIRDYNKSLIYNGMGEDLGGIANAVLYGEKSSIDMQYISIFKTTGIMHIFAVSGLHVSLIVSLLVFLLKKLRIPEKVRLIIISLFLLLFCYLCSFSSPVVRASIMAIIFIISKIITRKNDVLTTLSISGLVLLILNPINLFDGGFQMTFVAVFGILFFGSLFNKVKINNKILKDIFVLITTSLSTQLAMLPILAKFYGYYTTWSIIANLFTIPLFTIFYSMFFVINLFVLCMPFLKFLYLVPKAVLSLVLFINSIVYKLPFSMIKVYRWGVLATIFYFMFAFSISKFLMLKSKIKTIVSLTMLIISLFFILPNCLPSVSNKDAVLLYQNNDYSASGIISTKNNKRYLIAPSFSNANMYNLINEIDSKKIIKIDAVFVSGNNQFEAMKIASFLLSLNAKIYLPANHSAIYNLKMCGVEVEEVNFDTIYNLDNFSFAYYKCSNDNYVFYLNFNNFTYLEFDALLLNDASFYNLLQTHLNFTFNCAKINNNKTFTDVEYLKAKQLVQFSNKIHKKTILYET